MATSHTTSVAPPRVNRWRTEPALFARSTPADTATQVELEAVLERVTAGWRNAPPIVVFAGLADAKVPAAIREEAEAQR